MTATLGPRPLGHSLVVRHDGALSWERVPSYVDAYKYHEMTIRRTFDAYHEMTIRPTLVRTLVRFEVVDGRRFGTAESPPLRVFAPNLRVAYETLRRIWGWW
mgnify:CR=1 FL=1